MGELEELVGHYSKFVEFYDRKNQIIKYYFQEKTQILLSNKDVIHALSCPSQNLKIHELPSKTFSEIKVERRDTDQDMKSILRKSTYGRFNAEEVLEKRKELSYDKLKEIRAADVQIQLKLENELQLKRSSLSFSPNRSSATKLRSKTINEKIVIKYADIRDLNDTIVSKNLNTQEDIILEKINRRKTASMNRSAQKLLSNQSRGSNNEISVIRKITAGPLSLQLINYCMHIEYIYVIVESS